MFTMCPMLKCLTISLLSIYVPLKSHTLMSYSWLIFSGHNVFSYNLTSGVKQVHVSGLKYATSVSYSISDGSIYYVVCQQGNNMVTVYNSSWGLVSSMGKTGSEDGDLSQPSSAIVSSNNTILVADNFNSRISEFTMDGKFVNNLRIDGVKRPKVYHTLNHICGFTITQITVKDSTV